MRKVTASAVILTALTGCGQNGGIPSTQWSFEIPAEDEMSSLALNRDLSDTTDGTFVSSVGNRASTGQSAAGLDALSSGAYAEGMMGPAFKQPSVDIETTAELSAANMPGRSRLGSSTSSPTSSYISGYRPAAARPDPVAQVKAFLSANSSPSDLNNREPYRSDILTSSLPTVYLPSAASVTSTLGEPTNLSGPTNLASQPAYVDSTSFASMGLLTLEPPVEGIYSSSDNPPSGSYGSSSGFAGPLATSRDGLPVLEVGNPREVPIGTAILQDLQRAESIQAVQSLPVEENLNGSIDIDITPAEVSVAETLVAETLVAETLVEETLVDEQAASDQAVYVSTNGPTLESLQRSMVLREASPLVAYASQPAEADLAVEPTLTVEAIASNPDPDLPTLESLLETMPETAAQPNFTVDLPDSNAASPLIEGFNSIQPLSTLYLPIPEAISDSSDDAGLATHVSVVKGSLASLADSAPAARTYQASTADIVGSKTQKVTSLRSGLPYETLNQRNKATLSLVDKLATKRRQLVTY